MPKKITVEDFAEALTSFIEEYLEDKDYYKNPVMTIGYVKGSVAMEIHDSHKVNRPEGCQEFDLRPLYVSDELGVDMPNHEAIKQLAKQWVEKYACI